MAVRAAGNLWRAQRYYPWTAKRNGGMLESLKVGLSEGAGERLNRSYAYNYFGDITALTEETTSNSFTYDGLGRLTAAYGRTYSFDGANRLTAFNGQSHGFGDGGPYHAVDRIGGNDRFDYDANGNMTVRNKGLTGQQTLVWDAQNRLSEVRDNNGDMLEQYWYDVDGSRVKKVNGSTTTYTFFGHYEEEVTNGVTTAISHYTFGGLRVAVKRGNTLYHVHGDHLGSTSVTTAGSVVEGSRAYYAYGAQRSASGTLRTDRTFTGQKEDGTGLLYYNARYYDPALGAFISPDTNVPDPGMVIDYNRFLYARGNPLRYSDPSGYTSQEGQCDTQQCWEENFYWNDRWYRAHGYRFNKFTKHWTTRIVGGADFADMGILTDVLSEAGISLEMNNWTFDELKLLGQGVVEFGYRIGQLLNADVTTGLNRLKTLIGGNVTWYRAAKGALWNLCRLGAACALESGRIGFYDVLFTAGDSYVRGTAVHELAHKIEGQCGVRNDCAVIRLKAEAYRLSRYSPIRAHRHFISEYAWTQPWEYWAEAVTIWVYGAYKSDIPLDIRRRSYMSSIFSWVEGVIDP